MESIVAPLKPTLHRTVERLQVCSFATRTAMGRAAARDIAAAIRARLTECAGVRMIFAAAPSQDDMIDALVAEPEIDWGRVTAFHMDEYIGLAAEAPQRFALWLRQRLFGRLPFAAIHPIVPEPEPRTAAERYAAMLSAAPIDICRRQQVDDDCFSDIAAVPERAITLTIPRLLRADRLFCVVPGMHKRDAVGKALHGPISTDCPASVLRRHPNCVLYLDAESDTDG
jgi:glucosamine-6-phosphate deaminase